MRNAFTAALFAAALAAPLAFSAPAGASEAAEITAAVAMCRTEAAARAGVTEDNVRLDGVSSRRQRVRVDLDVWQDGQLTNVRCDVAREAALTITAINLPEAAPRIAAQ